MGTGLSGSVASRSQCECSVGLVDMQGRYQWPSQAGTGAARPEVQPVSPRNDTVAGDEAGKPEALRQGWKAEEP